MQKVADYSRTGNKIQEIVHYADSRFRAIMTETNKEINKTDVNRNSWVQTLLQRELVSFINYI